MLRGSLVLQRRKDPSGPTFSVLVMFRIEPASVFSTTKEQRNSIAKECGTRQKRSPAVTRDSIKKVKRRVRTTRKQRYATILRTLQGFSNFLHVPLYIKRIFSSMLVYNFTNTTMFFSFQLTKSIWSRRKSFWMLEPGLEPKA